MTALSEQQERVLRRVLRLVDLGRDLERNSDDAVFRADGGEIIYVLDENVFEIFVQPSRHRETVETFYADLWSDSGKGDETWRAFEAQSALIASEFMVAGNLPGSKGDSIFMTESHRWELATRLDDIGAELASKIGKNEDRARAELLRKLTVMRDLLQSAHEQVPEAASDRDGDLLEADMAKLARAGRDEAATRRIRAARVACALLARDELTEPLEQLRRVTTPPVRSRLRTLSVAYPASARDVAAMEVEASDWFEALVAELQRPGHKFRERAKGGDTGRALWNDARSIAYVRWVATRKARTNQRVVFITGDPVVFDAYRRWHASLEPDKPQYNEPFIMRRATQYIPVFNPIDTGGDLSHVLVDGHSTGTLFPLIQQAVEAALLPLTFSLIPRDGSLPGDYSGRRRELLALKSVDQAKLSDDPQLGGFADLLSAEWLSGQARRMDWIRGSWQEAQRLAVGSSYNLIAGRLNRDQLEIYNEVATTGAVDAGIALSEYLTRILGRLVEDSLNVWLPLAQEFGLGHSTGWFGTKGPPRMTVAFGPAPAGKSLVGGGPEHDCLTAAPAETVFADASRRALELQEFNNAERFAGLAVRADENARAKQAELPGFHGDLQYLHALTLRYLIATVRGRFDAERRTARSRGVEQVKSLHGRASRLLFSCLSVHHTGRDEQQDEARSYHAVRYLRALSERAALHLFVSASFGVAFKDEHDTLLDDALRFLEIAKGDLRLCLEAEKRVVLDGEKQFNSDETVLSGARKQFVHNFAAAEVLTFLLAKEDDYVFDESLRPLVRRIERLGATTDSHPVLVTFLEAFQVLAGRRARRARSAMRDRFLESRFVRLPLDRLLLRAIRRKIPAEASVFAFPRSPHNQG